MSNKTAAIWQAAMISPHTQPTQPLRHRHPDEVILLSISPMLRIATCDLLSGVAHARQTRNTRSAQAYFIADPLLLCRLLLHSRGPVTHAKISKPRTTLSSASRTGSWKSARRRSACHRTSIYSRPGCCHELHKGPRGPAAAAALGH